MFQRDQIKEGMLVRSIDGEKLGAVFELGEETFLLEKGLFFPKDYLVRYADISDIRDGELILPYGRESLSRLSDEAKSTAATRDGTTLDLGTQLTAGRGAGATATALRTDEVAIPLHKEELDISKRDVQTGEVRIHKEVVEEIQTVSVPVRHERIRLERRDVNPNQPVMNASFQEETIVVPLHAEQLDVQKRTVLDEEVIIHKDVIEEDQRVSESIRHEEVDIRAPEDDESKRSLRLDPEESGPRRS